MSVACLLSKTISATDYHIVLITNLDFEEVVQNSLVFYKSEKLNHSKLIGKSNL